MIINLFYYVYESVCLVHNVAVKLVRLSFHLTKISLNLSVATGLLNQANAWFGTSDQISLNSLVPTVGFDFLFVLSRQHFT